MFRETGNAIADVAQSFILYVLLGTLFLKSGLNASSRYLSILLILVSYSHEMRCSFYKKDVITTQFSDVTQAHWVKKLCPYTLTNTSHTFVFIEAKRGATKRFFALEQTFT